MHILWQTCTYLLHNSVPCRTGCTQLFLTSCCFSVCEADRVVDVLLIESIDVLLIESTMWSQKNYSDCHYILISLHTHVTPIVLIFLLLLTK